MEVDSSQAATALLTEHLQYTPLSLIDDIINSVNNFIYQGVGSLETGLLSTPPERLGFKAKESNSGEPEYPEAKQEIEEGLHQLETLLNSTVDKNFDKFEIYVLRNILSVPAELVNWVRLSHYEVGVGLIEVDVANLGQNLSYPPLPNAPSAESIQLLRRKLAASRSVSRALTQEHDRNEAVLQQLRALTRNASTQDNLSFLTQGTGAQSLSVSANKQALTTNVTFAMSQLPALKALLADLRPQLSRLKDMDLAMNSAKDERRQERREYIEQRTKTHLDRNGDAATDNSGILSGRIPDAEQIQALEKVAGILHPD